jgi:hypothetical protein
MRKETIQRGKAHLKYVEDNDWKEGRIVLRTKVT